MNNLKIDNACSINFLGGQDINMTKRQSEVKKLLETDSLNKKEYQKFLKYIIDNQETLSQVDINEMILNAGVLYKNNYDIISTTKSNETLLNFLLFIGDIDDVGMITTLANYLLDDLVIEEIYSTPLKKALKYDYDKDIDWVQIMNISSIFTKNFESFRQTLISKIMFISRHFENDIDIIKEINNLKKYICDNYKDSEVKRKRNIYRKVKA